MKFPLRTCFAIVAGLALAGQASAQLIEVDQGLHAAQAVTLPNAQTSVYSADYRITLSHDAVVTIVAATQTQFPFTIGALFDGVNTLSAPNQFTGGGTLATFSGDLDAGEHHFEALFTLPSVALGDTLFGATFDFSAVALSDTSPVTDPGTPSAVPEPGSPALLLLGGVGLMVAQLRRRVAAGA